MKFKYTARTKKGELQTGNIDAANREGALNVLSQHDLFVLELVSTARVHWYDRITSYFNRVKPRDLLVFTRQLSTLVEARVALSDSLRTLYRQTVSARLKEAIAQLSADIDAGLSLSQSLERHPLVFSEFYINMIRSAEVTGRMDEVLLFLADYLEKEYQLAGRVRNALIYPGVVIGLFVIVAGIMVVVVFPTITPIFKDSGVELPLFTKILIATSDFIISWWWAVLIMFGIVFVFVLDYVRTAEGIALVNELELKIPVIGGLLKKLYIARLSEAISVMLQGAIPTTQAIEIASHTVGNVVYRDLLHEVADRVNAGEQISQAFESNEAYFPPLLSQMAAVGESTGRLEDMLKKVARFYTEEVDGIVSNLVELIQPALMVAIGLLVSILFASILLPIYNLAQAF